MRVNITSSSNNKVGTNIVSLDEVFNNFISDVVKVFSDTVSRLTEVVISVSSEVNIFKEETLLIVLSAEGIVINSFLFSFNLLLVEDRVL